MILGLIFRPVGVEPERADFRVLRTSAEPVTDVVTFTAWEQIVRYLTERPWPEGQEPWVIDGDRLVDPDTIRESLPG